MNKELLIQVLDNGLTKCFNVRLDDLKTKLKPNTSKSFYVAFICYYLKKDFKIKTNTLAYIFNKSPDKIVIQINHFSKYFKEDFENSKTMSKDKSIFVKNNYYKFINTLKSFILQIAINEFESKLKNVIREQNYIKRKGNKSK